VCGLIDYVEGVVLDETLDFRIHSIAPFVSFRSGDRRMEWISETIITNSASCHSWTLSSLDRLCVPGSQRTVTTGATLYCFFDRSGLPINFARFSRAANLVARIGCWNARNVFWDMLVMFLDVLCTVTITFSWFIPRCIEAEILPTSQMVVSFGKSSLARDSLKNLTSRVILTFFSIGIHIR